MSNSAEITYAIQNDRPSIMIRVSAQEEGKSKPDLREMLSQIQEAIDTAQKKIAELESKLSKENVGKSEEA